MLDLSVIILTYNEQLHIRRCLENVCPIAKKVYVVDSPSTDKTVEICKEFQNVEVVVHKYPGNQAEQFNWALDNLKIDTEWVLRLDADEYMLPELVDELRTKVPSLSRDITGIEFKRRHIFMDKWVKRGIYPVIMMRMFRTGEACEVLNELYVLSSHIDKTLTLGEQAKDKHKKKGGYNKLPLFWRSFAYFCYRFFVKGAFLYGKEGFLFAFLQGWWYRTLVDAKILECKKACGSDREAMKRYIAEKWGINMNQNL